MFIQTETTPNPATLKFLPGRSVMEDGVVDITEAGKAEAVSPLAARLFAIDGVSGVYLGHDFISVTKGGVEDWYMLKPAVLGAIMEHFMSGDPVLRDDADIDDGIRLDESDATVRQIKELIDSRVRPAVAQDGGDIVFQGFDRGIVYLHMRGACSGCPSSTATLKSGIENLLRHFVPGVEQVEQV